MTISAPPRPPEHEERLDELERLADRAVDPRHGGTVYAGTVREGVFASRNGGTTWTRIGLAGLSVGTLAIEPATHTLYAGTSGAGLRLRRLGP